LLRTKGINIGTVCTFTEDIPLCLNLQNKKIVNFFAIKHNNSVLVISLFVIVATCFGHS